MGTVRVCSQAGLIYRSGFAMDQNKRPGRGIFPVTRASSPYVLPASRRFRGHQTREGEEIPKVSGDSLHESDPASLRDARRVGRSIRWLAPPATVQRPSGTSEHSTPPQLPITPRLSVGVPRLRGHATSFPARRRVSNGTKKRSAAIALPTLPVTEHPIRAYGHPRRLCKHKPPLLGQESPRSVPRSLTTGTPATHTPCVPEGRRIFAVRSARCPPPFRHDFPHTPPPGLHFPASRAKCRPNSVMMDLALFRLPDGKAWIGEGPFAEAAEPPPGDAFYVNDFALSSPTPWKIPSRLTEVPAGALPEHFSVTKIQPRIVWQKPATEWFKMHSAASARTCSPTSCARWCPCSRSPVP